MRFTRTAVLFFLLLISGHAVIAQELVSQARELYVTAHYEEALEALDGIEGDASTVSDHQAVREYRALCLIALDRSADAIRTLEQMIDADPFYRPAAERRPRRLIMLFDQVRRQRLPALGRERYTKATIAFDEHRNADAVNGFAHVLRLVEEAEAGSAGDRAAEQELTKLKAFATRFLELARARDHRMQAKPPTVRDAFDSADASVAPPVPIREDIPLWQSPTLARTPFEGALEVIIDPAGDVREARLTVPIHPAYDRVILDAARQWKYRPATKDGRPVTYRKIIAISLTPQRPLGTGP